MTNTRTKQVVKLILGVFGKVIAVIALLAVVASAYVVGFSHGVVAERNQTQNFVSGLLNDIQNKVAQSVPTPEPTRISKPASPYLDVSWGGPELWEAVNARRVQLGVNPLASVGEICTIASVRLNQQLELGKLDNHEGFSNMPEDRPDLKWIFEKYNLSEFLLSGAETPQEAVSLWENTLGHKQLLTGGEYVWGCIYAQNGFAVAIAAY